ncbi:MAG: hypothetical protein C0P62_005445 [Bacillota bacterium]|nr:hypothetical protein [Bacillota bacterium]
MAKALLSVEVPGIRRYVFGTDALREIRGASALLDEFNRVHMPSVVTSMADEVEVVFAGGGTALFLLPSDKAEAAAARLELEMRQRLGMASLNTAIVEVPDNFTLESDLQPENYYQLLGARLVVNKGVLPEVIGLPTHSLMRPCDSCGQNYAEDEVPAPDGQVKLLCGVCRRKWDHNRRLQQSFREGRLSGVWLELQPLLSRPDLLHRERPETTEQLAEADGPPPEKNNSLALIYADGDGLGTLLREARSLAEIRAASRGVHQAMLASVAAAIEGPLQPTEKSKWLPFDILLLGGDDLVLATTARRAFETAMVLAETFPKESAKQNIPRPLSLSLAVVFAHPHHPFRFMLDLADGCLRAAKRERFRRRKEQPDTDVFGLINYAFAGDAPGGDYAAYEDAHLRQEAVGDAPAVLRTLRPYTVDELKRMLRLAARLAEHKLPPQWLQALRETAYLDKVVGIRTGRMALARMGMDPERGTQPGDVARQVIDEIANGRPVEFPWIIDGDRLVNVWPELVDLMPLVRDMEVERSGRTR